MSFEIGTQLPEQIFYVDRALLKQYADASGDQNPIHQNEEFAKSVGLPNVIAHGMLTMGLVGQYAADWAGGSAQVLEYSARFTKPVIVPADQKVDLTVSATIGEVFEDGSVRLDLNATSAGVKVLGMARAKVKKVQTLVENLSSHTTLRVGGPANNFVRASNEAEIIAAIEAAGDQPVLILGSGSNVLISDTGFPGTVIQINNNKVTAEVDACSGATLNIGAGENWDDFVKTTIDRGWAGLETLSGIPGTVGAAPIQNIGAYGHEVSEFVMRVRTYDRQTKALRSEEHTSELQSH